SGEQRRHLLTVAMEDYYHVGAFNRLIQRGQWYRFETRVERGARATLDLLDEYDIRATFFVLGWIADTMPELVREVADRGHEIASKGYYHRGIQQLSPPEFREDLARAREALQRACGQRILGYRVADRWFEPADLWALDVLAGEGYEYDSSIAPILYSYVARPWCRFAHEHRFGDRTLWEFPISTASFLGCMVPIAGGNYFRQLPHFLIRRAVARWDRVYHAPFVMYFHTWEMDPDQPKIQAAPIAQRIRQYRHLERMPIILRHYFERYRFTGVADRLGLSTALAVAPSAAPRPASRLPERIREPAATGTPPRAADAERTPVTVVVPCYNEELILPYLANTLRSVEESLSEAYRLQFVFVDDCSRDGTLGALNQIFGTRPNCTVLHHSSNRGVAAGILTGIKRAETEIVCSIDCDCTYDPHELARMIPLLTDGVDLVTASPYHPLGGVRNVPQWRLFLSKTASRLYRLVLHQKIRTFTSCFRVYRRSAALRLRIQRSGFLGVAEMIGKLDLAGARIVEFPTTLEVRMLGRSKMKVLRTIVGHIGLLSELAWQRMFRRGRPAGVAAPGSVGTGAA
ncbi:MAG: glycosyltransferase, partial [Gemmatimonadales bacterium]